MNTYEITREKLGDAKLVCYGYKGTRWNGDARYSFRYGKNPVGKIFRTRGNIGENVNGLHFSCDPAGCLLFYPPRGGNRFFKVAAYEKVVGSNKEAKAVAQVIEFIEEYSQEEYLEIIKQHDRTPSLWWDKVCGKWGHLYGPQSK